ncbi:MULTISPECIES: hypothetical protein [Streptomyces]|uniref:hypothetical protein n=1 Tax=Streptomyces TaxID=1883 RepID=UPI00163C95CD|nr:MULTISPECIES: hypothetical protein [Streptomyces]MBC2876461.1 hypothetical protein [Streptomyces sp. TYQ1024]UBI40865.1 hypothetical protein K7I03_33300 [Streptomyces mobaraensis]
MAVGMMAAGPATVEAQGAAAAVSCVGTNTVGFSPGLGLQARRTRISGTGVYTCPSAHPGFASATSVISGGGVNGCFASDATTVEKITWRNGAKSVVIYPMGAVQQVAGQAVVLVVGKVVSGAFRGRTVASPGVQLTLDVPACTTARGVREITGPSTLAIL